MSLSASHIDLHIGSRQILFDVTFTARSGAFTAICGPNGSGKSTLLKALTAELPAEGDIQLNGWSLDRYRPWQLASLRAVLPQSVTLAFPFSVIEVVRLGLGAGPYAAEAEIAHEALARVDLDGYAQRSYQLLSGGEQQRVQLARVLAQVWHPRTETGARWLLLDEPVSSLDIAHQLTVMDIARDFARAGGGVVAVMHDLNLTAMYADHIHMMAGGRTAASGPPAEVLTDATLSQVYGCTLRTRIAPPDGGVYVLPQAASR